MTRKTTTEIIEMRAAAGLSQRALAEKLGVSHETVRILEQDHRPITAIEQAAIRKACAPRAAVNGNGALAERFRRLEEKAAWIERELVHGYELLGEPALSNGTPMEVK
jgi:transcriptional regulator with XRE-family HTH domain